MPEQGYDLFFAWRDITGSVKVADAFPMRLQWERRAPPYSGPLGNSRPTGAPLFWVARPSREPKRPDLECSRGEASFGREYRARPRFGPEGVKRFRARCSRGGWGSGTHSHSAVGVPRMMTDWPEVRDVAAGSGRVVSPVGRHWASSRGGCSLSVREGNGSALSTSTGIGGQTLARLIWLLVASSITGATAVRRPIMDGTS